MITLTPLHHLAAEQKSAEVTRTGPPASPGWPACSVFVALVYWLMRQGWKWRASLQSGLPELPEAPEDFASDEPLLTLQGRYPRLHHRRAVARPDRRARPGHPQPYRADAHRPRPARPARPEPPTSSSRPTPCARPGYDKALAGKVLPEGGLLIIAWAHGETLIDSGFRSDRAAEHPAWVDAVTRLAAAPAATELAGTTTTEGTAR
ncbi:hypothetical protein SCALM49S_06303 [Streptomyces californicus]